MRLIGNHGWFSFLRSLEEQVRCLQTKVEREKIVLAVLQELSLKVVEFAREHRRITMNDSVKLTGSAVTR